MLKPRVTEINIDFRLLELIHKRVSRSPDGSFYGEVSGVVLCVSTLTS